MRTKEMGLIFKINYSRQYHTKCKEKLAKAWGGEGRVGPDPVYFHLWIGEKLRRHIVKRKLQIALLVYRTSGKSWGFYESRIFQGANHVSRWFTNSRITLFFLKNSRFTCQKPSSTKSTFPLQLHGRTGYGNENWQEREATFCLPVNGYEKRSRCSMSAARNLFSFDIFQEEFWAKRDWNSPFLRLCS